MVDRRGAAGSPVRDRGIIEPCLPENPMNDETFNLGIRKFLKMVGVNSQRAIEQEAARAMAAGEIKGNEKLPATVTLEIAGLRLSAKFAGDIALE